MSKHDPRTAGKGQATLISDAIGPLYREHYEATR
jgi:hypothetical protein